MFYTSWSYLNTLRTVPCKLITNKLMLCFNLTFSFYTLTRDLIDNSPHIFTPWHLIQVCGWRLSNGFLKSSRLQFSVWYQTKALILKTRLLRVFKIIHFQRSIFHFYYPFFELLALSNSLRKYWSNKKKHLKLAVHNKNRCFKDNLTTTITGTATQ